MSASPRRAANVPRAIAWTLVATAIAFGAGGLVVSLDHPAGQATRPELTSRRDQAVAPRMTALATEVAALDAPVRALRDAGREALRHVSARDDGGLRETIDTVDRASAELAAERTAVESSLRTLPSGTERLLLGDANQARIDAVERSLRALDATVTAWTAVRRDAVDRLADGPHDEASRLVNDAVLATEAAAGALDTARDRFEALPG